MSNLNKTGVGKSKHVYEFCPLTVKELKMKYETHAREQCYGKRENRTGGIDSDGSDSRFESELISGHGSKHELGIK